MSLVIESVKLLQYRRASLNLSDHRPVVAVLRVPIKRIAYEKLQDIYKELLHSVDKWVNAAAPRLNVEERLVDLGIISCDVSVDHVVPLPTYTLSYIHAYIYIGIA